MSIYCVLLGESQFLYYKQELILVFAKSAKICSTELLDWGHDNLLASVRQMSKENSQFLLLKAGLWVCVYFSWDIPTYFVLFLPSQCVCMAFMSSLPPSVFRHAFVPNLIFHNSQSDHFCFWSFCNSVSYFSQCTIIQTLVTFSL